MRLSSARADKVIDYSSIAAVHEADSLKVLDLKRPIREADIAG
jgi:hypothetical protein